MLVVAKDLKFDHKKKCFFDKNTKRLKRKLYFSIFFATTIAVSDLGPVRSHTFGPSTPILWEKIISLLKCTFPGCHKIISLLECTSLGCYKVLGTDG